MGNPVRLLAGVIYIVFVLFATPVETYAAVASCEANVSPTNVSPGSTNTYNISLNNTGAETVTWVKISRPSANFTITGHSIGGGWSVSQNSSDLTLTGASMAAGGGATFSITATAGSGEASSANWTVTVSDDSGGASPTACTGSLGTSVSSTPPDTSGPEISSLVVSDITDSGAKITWTTDESSNTVADYGATGDYGSTATGDSSVTSHSVSISGLSANTTYHYNAKSTDSSGNSSESGDNTFVTAKSGYTGTSTTGTVTTRTVTATPSPTPVPDRTPPRVTLTTKFEKFFTKPPVIEGKATDPSGVASVEYSMDNGENFLPVDELSSSGKTSTGFSFTPYQSDDGNYTLVIRAADTKGNIGKTKGDTVIIDRLPPVLGPFLLSVGPQIIAPHGNLYQLLTGQEYKLSLSAVGGPTDVTLNSWRQEKMKKNGDNGLWSVPVRFDAPGTYELTGVAVDGAANRTLRSLGTVNVVPAGTVRDELGNPVSQARITVQYLDTVTHRFIEWDGASYGQKNPVPTGADGAYTVLLPPGTFYLSVSAPAFRTLVSDIFTVKEPQVLTQNFSLARKRALKIGSWIIPLPDFRQTRQVVDISTLKNDRDQAQKNLSDSEFPFFRFPYEATTLSSLDLRGKPAIITFLNSWSPGTPVQLAGLADIAKKAELQVLVIFPMESAASVATFTKRGAYAVRILADPDGTLIAPLDIRTLPTHFIVTRKGVIQSVIEGLATKEELLDTIIQ